MLEEIIIAVGAVVVLLIVFIAQLKIRLSKPKNYQLVLIIALQFILSKVWNQGGSATSLNLLLLIELLLAMGYVVIDKDVKFEEAFIFPAKKEGQKKAVYYLKCFFFPFFGGGVIIIRWIEFFLTFVMSMGIYARMVDDKELVKAFPSFVMLVLVLIVVQVLFDYLSFGLNIKSKYFYLVLTFTVFVGLFNAKWWTGIGLLTTILGMAFSEDFFKRNTNIHLWKNFDDSFLKIMIPYTALIFYFSLIIVQEILPREVILFVLDVLSGAKTNPNSFLGGLTVSLYLGVLELLLFFIFWQISKVLLFRSQLVNQNFNYQFTGMEAQLREMFMRKTTRKKAYKVRTLDSIDE
ncbi:hypothetical protein EGCR1_17555 (plasmid) [Enterococcus gilvus]|jgi:hypothetical protein|uniref:hypothetical protein n=1 Tax=Enterococcus gilvus TaxID=160453 RepID=UPI000DF60D4A|nr:hypothetical protein [Enterococcus gilvus]AXG40507.1 hypothetical protein EGCR1_17555 [Enterococcus gilvus]